MGPDGNPMPPQSGAPQDLGTEPQLPGQPNMPENPLTGQQYDPTSGGLPQ